MAITVGNMTKEFRNKYDDFSKGSSLGEEIRETLKNGEEWDNSKISKSERQAIQEWFNKNFSGESIDEKEILAFATSKIARYFSADHDGGFYHNSNMIFDLFDGKLGVAITEKANRIAQVLDDTMTDGDLDYWLSSISEKPADEAAALKAMALINYDEEGESYGSKDISVSEADVKEIKSLRSTFKENLHDLADFVSKMYDSSEKKELTAFVESMGGTVPAAQQ